MFESFLMYGWFCVIFGLLHARKAEYTGYVFSWLDMKFPRLADLAKLFIVTFDRLYHGQDFERNGSSTRGSTFHVQLFSTVAVIFFLWVFLCYIVFGSTVQDIASLHRRIHSYSSSTWHRTGFQWRCLSNFIWRPLSTWISKNCICRRRIYSIERNMDNMWCEDTLWCSSTCTCHDHQDQPSMINSVGK